MAITVTQLRTHLEVARVAIATSDFAAARLQLMSAQACLAGLPDGKRGETEVSWREIIENLLQSVRQAERDAAVTSAGGIQRTKINYVSPTE